MSQNLCKSTSGVLNLVHWLIGILVHLFYSVIFGFKYVYKISTTRFVKTKVIA
jgi:hypothetical protein